MNILDNLKNPPKKYRPVPFWSWNEKLDTEETKRQIKVMDEAGIGGFFMHARGGLQTEYMSEEWFCNVTAAKDEANKRGMYAWAYDENGWPSGFGGGVVNGMGVKYQQKYLRMESTPEHTDTQICSCGNHWFYYEINPFYVDTLSHDAINEFIKCTYVPYYEKYGNEIEGFFTDEPQISRNGIPWSFVFEEEYKTRYNDDILLHLEELFLPVGNYKDTRIKFWKMVTDLFSSAYMKQIYDWCDSHNLKFTGHLVFEESLINQITSNGACTPHYEYFHIPGMDWLGRKLYDCLTTYQLSSVAQQLGKKTVLSETFALCGHNVSFAELKGIYEWQMVHGINLLCQHLEGYSLRGIRKRDYPPAMYYQQPWWSKYKDFNDAVSRMGMLLAEGEATADILVLHPQTTAWTMFDNDENKGIEELDSKFYDIIRELEHKHVAFHLGDETIMERHAETKDGKMIIGSQSYSKIIMSHCDYLLPSTEKLIEEFKASGGEIITVADVEASNVCDNSEITYTSRSLDGFKLHYFTNTSPDRKTAKINVCGRKLDIYTGEFCEFEQTYEFEPWGSLMIIEDSAAAYKPVKKEAPVYLSGSFKVSQNIENALTLDYCDYYFDGELQEKNGYVLSICERANALARPVKLHQDYFVNIEKIPSSLYLVCETPDKFVIKVNGTDITEKPCGYFADKSFEKIDIAKYVKCGENIISFDCTLSQSAEFYENLKKAAIFESEKNKLVYDMEIEAIYLIGDFGVKTEGKWENLDKNAMRYSGGFEITSVPENIELKNIQTQGFPFFCGELTVEGEIDICGENPVLMLDSITGINALCVEIGGKTKTVLTDTRLSLTDFGAQGKQKVKLTLINNLRNLLGPHHLTEGECHHVWPGVFFKELCIWNSEPWYEVSWDDDYCFVNMGI